MDGDWLGCSFLLNSNAFLVALKIERRFVRPQCLYSQVQH